MSKAVPKQVELEQATARPLRRRKQFYDGSTGRYVSDAIDGRSLRRTGRTAVLSVRVKEDLHARMRKAADDVGITLGACVEIAFASWLASEDRLRRSLKGQFLKADRHAKK